MSCPESWGIRGGICMSMRFGRRSSRLRRSCLLLLARIEGYRGAGGWLVDRKRERMGVWQVEAVWRGKWGNAFCACVRIMST